MLSIPKKNCQLITQSGNHYIGALKNNQPNLYKETVANFIPNQTYFEINKGHGRVEKRTVSICQVPDHLTYWPGLQTLIRVESERELTAGHLDNSYD